MSSIRALLCTTASIVLFLFGHIGDACNQPLGLCVLTFWISVASKLSLILLWSGCEGFLTECCDGLTFRNLSACLSGSFAIFTVLFEVIWPVTTFIMLLLADSCTPGLIASTWFLLSPFFLEALCCWPILSSCHPKVDPVDLMDTLLGLVSILIPSTTKLMQQVVLFVCQTFPHLTISCWPRALPVATSFTNSVCLAGFKEPRHVRYVAAA